MKQDIKVRWLEALRSGEYQQTEGMLQDNDGYCCLGVLCEIAVADGIVDVESGVYFVSDGDDSNDSELPDAVAEWAGLESTNPLTDIRETPEGRQLYISELNDDLRYTFPEIAEVIERVY